jgi:hypothetical protein
MASPYKEDPYDSRDKPYACRKPGVIPKYVDLSLTCPPLRDKWLLPYYDQGTTSTCAANATAAAFRYLAWKLQAELKHGAKSNITTDPSRAYIYYFARLIQEKEQKRL